MAKEFNTIEDFLIGLSIETKTNLMLLYYNDKFANTFEETKEEIEKIIDVVIENKDNFHHWIKNYIIVLSGKYKEETEKIINNEIKNRKGK